MPTSNLESLLTSLVGDPSSADTDQDEIEAMLEQLRRYGSAPREVKSYRRPGQLGPSGSFPQSAAPLKTLATLNPNNRVIQALLQTVLTRRAEAGA